MRLVLKNLSASIAKRKLLYDINLEFSCGKFYAVIGPNGAGKSSLLKSIAGISTQTKGDILFENKPTKTIPSMQKARLIAYMAQFFEDSALSVFDCLALGRRVFSNTFLHQKDKDLILKTALDLDIAPLDMPMSYLSGGERQKVFIASALLQSPRILLLDEPISHLDPKNQHEMLELVRKETIAKNMITIAVVHDIHHALHYADVIVMLKNGSLHGCKTNNALEDSDLKSLFDMTLKMYKIQGHTFIHYFHSHDSHIEHEH